MSAHRVDAPSRGVSLLNSTPWGTIDSGTRRMLVSTASMLASTGVTSGLGFLFWVVAARTAPIAEVGAATAIISAMTLAVNIGQFGFGTMLLAEGAHGRRQFGVLVSTSLILVAVLSGLLTLVAAVALRQVDTTLGRALSDWAGLIGLVAGVVLGAPALVLDEAVIGVRLAGVQLWRNSVFAISKLAVLWLGAAYIEYFTRGEIVFSWVVGSALSLVAAAVELRRRGLAVWHWPKLTTLRGLGRRTADHNLLNLAQMAPRLGVPLLAASVLGEADNAAFFAAWMLASFLYMVPTHLSTALFAIAVGDRRALADRLRSGLVLLTVAGLLGMAGLAGFAGLWLSLFGSGYQAAEGALLLLVLAYVPCVLKQLYIAIERVEDRLRVSGMFLGVVAVLELAGALVGGALDGMAGVAGGYLVGAVLAVPVYLLSLVRTVQYIRVGG